MIGIAVADKLEWKQILELYNINSDYTEKYPYGEFYRTVFKNKEVVFFRTGTRKVNSAGAMQFMLDKFEFNDIILIGTCAAVDDLDYGDVIVPDSVVEYDLTIREIQPLVLEESIIKLNPQKIGNDYISGMIGTSDKALVLYKDYLKLKEETEIIASDQEAAAIAKICRINNINLTIIKGVTDKPIKGDNLEEQVEIYEENAPIVIKNILENYLTEVIK